MIISGFTVSLDVAITTLADVGPQTASVVCVSTDYPGAVPSVTYPMSVTIQECTVASFSIA
jgi:hypothetical protein